MNAQREIDVFPFDEFEQLREACEIIREAAQTLVELSRRLDSAFCAAVRLITTCRGTVVVTGMGKAGLIGRKIAATLSSTGTRAVFLHPAEAVHGDLGCVCPADVVLALSNSGQTEELCRLLPMFRRIGVPLVAVTARQTSTLGSAADVAILLGHIPKRDISVWRRRQAPPPCWHWEMRWPWLPAASKALPGRNSPCLTRRGPLVRSYRQ